MFIVLNDWQKDNDKYSKQGFTKGYTLTPKLKVIKQKYLSNLKSFSFLITDKGRRAKAVSQELLDHNVTQTNQIKTSFKQITPVNFDALDNLISEIKETGEFMNLNPHDIIQEIQTLKKYCHVTPSGKKVLNQRYCSSTSGRLYAKGHNLQNIRKPIKNAALSGLFEYDFENCHYSILYQEASKIGINCTGIEYYLNHKPEVRALISNDTGITVKDTKQVLISTIYGASRSLDKDHAIPKLITPQKAELLYKHPVYKNIMRDISSVGRKLIKAQPIKGNKIINAMGKSMLTVKNNKPVANRYLLAHILQGIEAAMLHTVIDMYGEKIVLFQHDGFVSTEELNKQTMRGRVKEQHEIDIGITMEVLTAIKKITNKDGCYYLTPRILDVSSTSLIL